MLVAAAPPSPLRREDRLAAPVLAGREELLPVGNAVPNEVLGVGMALLTATMPTAAEEAIEVLVTRLETTTREVDVVPSGKMTGVAEVVITVETPATDAAAAAEDTATAGSAAAATEPAEAGAATPAAGEDAATELAPLLEAGAAALLPAAEEAPLLVPPLVPLAGAEAAAGELEAGAGLLLLPVYKEIIKALVSALIKIIVDSKEGL